MYDMVDNDIRLLEYRIQEVEKITKNNTDALVEIGKILAVLQVKIYMGALFVGGVGSIAIQIFTKMVGG
jgi:hypothetical protein